MKPPVELDLVDDDAIRQGMTYSIGFQIIGDFGSVLGENMIDTSAMEARFKIRATDYDGDVACEGSTDDGRVVLGYSPGEMQRATAYVVGEQVVGAGFDGFLYECIDPGTTDGGPVVLDDTPGNQTPDGTVIWECLGVAADNSVVNAYILLPATYTETLVDWGRGRWDFELVDGSTVFRLFEGVARLSREVTY